MADKSEGPDSADAEKTGEKSPQSDDNATNETIKSSPNVFKNDGSFLEMFKKKLEEEKQRKQSSEQVAPDSSDSSSSSTTTDETKTSRLKDDVSKTAGNSNETEQKEEKAEATAKKKYSLLSHVGKRRGGKLTLKTGQVKKPKQNEQDSAPKDAWSKYMSEVEKYKAHVCSDEDKVRPLVK